MHVCVMNCRVYYYIIPSVVVDIFTHAQSGWNFIHVDITCSIYTECAFTHVHLACEKWIDLLSSIGVPLSHYTSVI